MALKRDPVEALKRKSCEGDDTAAHLRIGLGEGIGLFGIRPFDLYRVFQVSMRRDGLTGPRGAFVCRGAGTYSEY